MMPKFSIIIPLYNGKKHIEATLDSVLGQTCKNYEIIMVNDGSPDDVGVVVKNYIAKHPQTNFIYLEQKNKGLGGARNTAMRHANGEIIAILDQDDIWYPEKLEKVNRIFMQYPAVDIVCHNCAINIAGTKRGVYQTGPYSKKMYRKMLFGGNRLLTLTTSFKRSLLDSVGYFSEDKEHIHLAEDYDLWLRMAKAGCKFHFMSDILAEYVRHEDNFSLLSVKCMLDSQMHVVNMHYLSLDEKLPLDWYRLRKRKAQILYMAACRSLSSINARFRGLRYLFQAVEQDPLFLFSLMNYCLGKIRKTIINQGV